MHASSHAHAALQGVQLTSSRPGRGEIPLFDTDPQLSPVRYPPPPREPFSNSYSSLPVSRYPTFARVVVKKSAYAPSIIGLMKWAKWPEVAMLIEDAVSFLGVCHGEARA